MARQSFQLGENDAREQTADAATVDRQHAHC
jgi:hypothetical protein